MESGMLWRITHVHIILMLYVFYEPQEDLAVKGVS